MSRARAPNRYTIATSIPGSSPTLAEKRTLLRSVTHLPYRVFFAWCCNFRKCFYCVKIIAADAD